MLANELRVRGFNVLPTCEPGGTPLGRRLREAFLETEENVSPLAELLLFAADRAQHINFLVKPALSEGKIVISDRYADATFAYQGAGRGCGGCRILHLRAIDLCRAGARAIRCRA